MSATATARGARPAGYVLGFALGGFFDGILLHQILQWHHLLSTVNGTDIRFQVAADGYFHALMYLLAAVGLWLLWRSRRDAGAGSGRRLAAALLIGFGVWHVVDSVASHWVLGIHRIRMDTDNRLFWDLLWLVVFGVVPLAIGWVLSRSPGRPGGLGAGGRAFSAGIGLFVIAAGAFSARPPADNRFTTVLFSPGTTPTEATLAVAGIGGRVAWTDRSGQLVVFENTEVASALPLFSSGAILVGGSGLPAGCFAWSRA